MKYHSILFTVLAVLAPALSAAPITWSTSTISAPADVSLTGTLVGALNVGGQGSLQTVNGVTFAADPGGAGAIPLGAATVAFTFDDSFDNDFWAGSNPGGSGTYHSALDSGRSTDATRSGTVTLGGLVSGTSYQVQLWIADTRTSPYVLGTRVRTVDGVATTAGGPNIATGTFTADAGTQVITITGTTGDNITAHGPQVNLLQLRALPPTTPNAPIVVTSTADSGAGSLRAAIAAAASAPGPDTIVFSAAIRGQTITVGSTRLTINDPDLSIDGEMVALQRATAASSPMIFISGGKLRLHQVHLLGGGSGVVNGGAMNIQPGAFLEMTNCTVSGHHVGDGSGAALSNTYGTASLRNCTFTGNHANFGGALANVGTLHLTHCTVVANVATQGGGGIVNHENGVLTLTNCIAAQNSALNNFATDLYTVSGTVQAKNCFIGSGTDSTIVDGTRGNRVGTVSFPIVPNLAPLGYYGTRGRNLPPTMPPLPGSPVIGMALVAAGSEIEQGGSPRGVGQWTNDFSAGLDGAVARGGGTLTALADFRLTLELPSQAGSLSLPVIAGMEGGFLATFDYIFNAASGPADGFSFCWGQDPGYVINNAGDGVAHRVRFDIYNGGNDHTGRISYKRGDSEVGPVNTTALHRFNDKGIYHPVTVRLFPGGRLVVTFKGITVIDVETGYVHTPGDRIMIGAGTGGLMATQAIDNIGVRTGPLGSQDTGAAQTLTTAHPVVWRGDDADRYEYTRTSDGSVQGFTLRQAVRWAAGPAATLTINPVLNGSGVLLSSEINLAESPANTVTVDASGLSRGFSLDAGGTPAGTSVRRLFNVPNTRTLNLTGLTLTNGRAGGTANEHDGYGGAIYSYGNLTLTRCTLSANTCHRGGGALFNGNFATLVRCTVTGSYTNLSSGTAGGGAIRNVGNLTLDQCTVAGNGSLPGAIFNDTSASLTCRNSLLYNTDFGGWNVRNQGTFNFTDGNLATGSVNNTGTVNGAPTRTSPVLLAPLGDYGGPTQTMALRPGSAAIGAAIFSTGADQRGFPLVGTADLGAYESGTHTNCNAWLWETLPLSVPENLITPSADIDGDGASNEHEWNARTDPNNAASILRITSITRSGANLEITFPTATGRTYTLWQSDDLSANPGWTSIQPSAIAAVVGRMTFTIAAPGAGKPKRFYRVQAGP